MQFLRNKADVNFVNEHGNTALHYACFGNYPAIAEDLVEFGGLVNIENKYHETPLEKCQGNLAKRLHGNISVWTILILIQFNNLTDSYKLNLGNRDFPSKF